MKLYATTNRRFTALLLAAAILFTLIPAYRVPAKAADPIDTTTKDSALTGTNDGKMNTAMEDGVTPNIPATPGSEKDWQQNLSDQWDIAKSTFAWDRAPSVPDDWKWDGKFAHNNSALNGNDGFLPGSITDNISEPRDNPIYVPHYDAASQTWSVFSGQQLYFALTQVQPGETIKILKDIDLKGYEYNWLLRLGPWTSTEISSFTNITLDGLQEDGTTSSVIYNLGCSDTSFLKQLNGSTVQNLIFESAKVVRQSGGASIYTGIFGDIKNNSAELSTLKNVEIVNSLFFNGYSSTNHMNQTYLAPFGHISHVTVDDCYTRNNVMYGGTGVHVGGAFARANDAVIQSSYSVDSVVIAAGAHSGGFISCSDAAASQQPVQGHNSLHVKDCFTNNTVYGNTTTGVFMGALNLWGNTLIESCYTSGSIEGQNSLGGFIGLVENIYDNGSATLTIKNSYSTSIVGMRSGGNKLGGFVGNINLLYGAAVFTDCYAAGEVGSIDTDVSPNRTLYKDVGGFLGSVTNSDKVTYTSSYYDKQTTGMREWETGTTRDIAPNYVDATLGDNAGENNILGLRGVLTSDSAKSGAGLASHPSNDNKGFTGFSSSSGWVFDGGSVNDENYQHNCMYPQLDNFYNATTANWGDHADMVKAFSYASAATVHQQVWDRCLNPEHASLSTLVYDTVRDLTRRFSMTSYITPPAGTGDVSISWNHDQKTVSLYDKTLPVIGYFQKFYLDSYKREYQIADQFAPGISWFTVTTNVNGAIGTRRLRIIPTANINPGADRDLKANSTLYNHATDVRLAYSTGQRMSADFDDITQGVYPVDSPAAGSLKNLYVSNNGVFEATGTATPASFGSDKGNFDNINMQYMTGGKTPGSDPLEHLNNYLRVYLYKASVAYDNGSKLYKLSYKDTDRIAITPDNDWGKKLNGEKTFEDKDFGRYVLEYNWVLPDSRFIRSSVMLTVKPDQNTVEAKVVDEDGTAIDSVMRMDVRSYNTATGAPNPDFSNGTQSEISIQTTSGQPVLLAQQKDENSPHRIMDITFEITTVDSVQTKTFQSVKVGEAVTFPVTYYYDSQGINSEYFVKAETVEKQYTLKYDFVKNYYYMDMAGEYKINNDAIELKDLEDNIKMTVVVQNLQTYDLTASAYAGGSIVSNDGTTAGGATKVSTVDAGSSKTYTFAPDAGYVVDDVKIDGVSIGAVSSYTFTNINADHKVEVAFKTDPAATTYTITALYGMGGTVKDVSGAVTSAGSPLVITNIAKGADQGFTITPDAGYKISSVSVNGALQPIPADGTYTFTDIQANHVIKVNFVTATSTATNFTVTALAETGGNITHPGAHSIAKDADSPEFEVIAGTDYQVKDVLIDGIVTQPSADNKYRFTNVQQNHIIVARFEPIGTPPVQHTINSSAGTGGTISPLGDAKVDDGGSQKYTITPGSGYQVKDVLVDGVSVGKVTSYDFINVSANHTISVTFESTGGSGGGGGGGGGTTTHTLEYKTEAGGTITGDATQRVEHGKDGTTVTAVPKDGYSFLGWSDGITTATRQDKDIRNSLTVTALFRANDEILNKADHFGYIIGYTDGSVRPMNSITRAEVATIFFRLLKDDIRQASWQTKNPFSDIVSQAWHNNAISTMYGLGVVKGTEDGSFQPDAPITRAEFAAIAARFDSKDYTGPDLFTDISGHWAANSINRAAVKGWVQGSGDGTFRPNDPITRAEAVTLVNRVLERDAVTENSFLPNMIVWPDNLSGQWYYAAMQEATNSHSYKKENGLESWTKLEPLKDWKSLEQEWAMAKRK